MHTATGGGYGGTFFTLIASEVENDKAIILVPTAQSVGEGSTATYTVKLSVLPTADVTVTIAAGTGDSDITVTDTDDSQSGNQTGTIVFTTSTWNTARTVTLSAAEDNTDIVHGVRSITHSATSTDAGYNNTTATLTATEADNDTGTVVLRNAADSADITGIFVPENGNTTYKVKLSHKPRGNVTVRLTYQSGGDSDITYNKSSLYFNATNWSTAQTVTLRARDDNDQAVGTRTIIHTSSGGGYSATANLAASEAENDYAIILSPAAGVSVPEGGTNTYTVKLSVLPTAAVTVTLGIIAGGDSDISASPGTLNFTTQNWNTAQTVTVTAAEDDADLTNGSVTIRHSGSGGGYDNVTASLTATEADNDSDGAVLLRNFADTAAITTQDVREGSTARYKVKLDKEPRGNVTVTISAGAGDDDLTVVSSRTLTFTPNNWNTAKTVTLRAAQDNGMAFGARTITHTPSGANNGYASASSLTARELDDDVMIEIIDDGGNDTTALNVMEGGSATYKVKLSTMPLGDVTVALTAVGGDGDITFSPASLTFTTSTYGTGQTVTVSAAADSDTSNGSKTIRHNASGGGYDYAAMATLGVREQDGPTLSLTATARTVTTTIAQHTGAWYYKFTGNVQCNSVAQGTTEVSTASLAWNTEYTVTGYSDSSCSTVLAPAASVTTLNPTLTVPSTSITATTASLTLSNWDITKDGSWYYKANAAPHTSCSSAQTSLTANLTGLSMNTAYTYTAYNSSTCSTALDAADEFTSSNPSLVGANVTATTALLGILSWSISKDGNWYYKAATGPHTSCSTAQTDFNAELTGLTASTTYAYTAYSDSGCATQIVAGSFTTLSASLTTSNVGATAATLTLSNWNISKDGNWYYKANTGPHTSCSSAQTSLSFNVTGLTASTTYAYTSYSDSGCSTTIDAAPSFTTATPSLSSTATSNSVTVTISGWNISTDGYWYIQLNQVSSDCSLVTNPNFTVGSLLPSTSYTFRGFSDSGCANAITALHTKSTTAQTQGGNQIQQHQQSSQPAQPSAPGGVSGLSASHGGGSVSVSWSAAARATGYDVVYSTDGKVSWTRAATNQSGTSYTLSGADSSKSYVFGVRAVNSGGASGWTNSAPAEAPTPPPGGVSSVSATHNGGSVSVSWDAADGATGYDVNYSTDGKYTWTRAASGHSGTSYTLSGADSSKSYVFSVRAVNDAGSSGWTNSGHANPPQEASAD